MAKNTEEFIVRQVEGGVSKDLQKFLEYQTNNPDVKPLFQIPVFASVSSKPPETLSDWPQGQLTIYPDFLAFLTLVEGNPGQEPLWKRVIQESIEDMVSLYRLNRMITNPHEIITEIARHMAGRYQHEDTLGKALANPNSIFMSLDELTHTSTEHSWRNGDSIKLSTHNKQVIICEDCNGEMASASGLFGGIKLAFTGTIGMFTGAKWHPELISMLEKRVKENLAKKTV